MNFKNERPKKRKIVFRMLPTGAVCGKCEPLKANKHMELVTNRREIRMKTRSCSKWAFLQLDSSPKSHGRISNTFVRNSVGQYREKAYLPKYCYFEGRSGKGGQKVESDSVKCIACAEQILRDAKICRFCHVRQDDPTFIETNPTEIAAKAESKALKKKIVVWASVAVIILLGGWAGTTAATRSPVISDIADTIKGESSKLTTLGMMGRAQGVECTAEGISLLFNESIFKCFVNDSNGKGYVYKVTMNWSTGMYQYGLDK